MVVGSWWLLRELEASSTRAVHVGLHVGEAGRLVARLSLPASKSDQEARGVTRGHACTCAGAPSPGCPAHALADQLRFLERQFPGHFVQGVPSPELPLFPDAEGGACAKDAVVRTILFAATALGLPTSSPDGAERISGHTLRVTGAQGLDRAGFSLWAIQLLGRWAGDAIQGYVRAAHVDVFERAPAAERAAGPRRAVSSQEPDEGRLSLEELVAEVLGRCGAAAAASSPPTSASSEPGPAELGPLVDRAVAAQIEVALPPVREGLLEALRAELRTRSVPPAPAGSPVYYVRNPRTKRCHRVLVGPPAARSAWTTACSWPCGVPGRDGVAEFVSEDALPQEPSLLCGLCLPELREDRKAALCGALPQEA